ncbi:MAG: hypothetical protein JO273_03630 [Methylobacteriaceae bacterium]|nr:hypothetical protein [Methylobacteriaceae bacterium]
MNSKTGPSVTCLKLLYDQAFASYRAQALWNVARHVHPTAADAMAVARSLRVNGDREARRLAEAIEREAADGAHGSSA